MSGNSNLHDSSRNKQDVVVETFNVSINVIGILPSPEVDTDANPEIPIPTDLTGPAK